MTTDLESLDIRNQPGLTINVPDLRLPVTLTTLGLRNVRVDQRAIAFGRSDDSGGHRLRDRRFGGSTTDDNAHSYESGDELMRLRRQSGSNDGSGFTGLVNLTSLSLSNVGLTGVIDPSTWFVGVLCPLQSLSLSGNDVTSIDASGCSGIVSLDLVRGY